MKVQVTQEHITNGVVKNSQHCMIADAIKACNPNAQYIMVDLQSIRFSDKDAGTRYTYFTPPIAQHNLLKFDKGEKCAPFTFNLSAPKKREMGWSGQHNGAERPKAKKRSAAHKKKYAYLSKNRALAKQREREFGLRKFV